ncbi:hypothetical protein DVJ77_20485 [Dyella tabacisoli]|uniref:TonB C-terminal domain-containing protein n=1 Tax=Dyella tabacisoli TaxID=2282381 RepID=A0A369UGI2_9GAMM|nr:cell envelope integrity protein TolA [Dyella tabacisoli]RDD79842.1 hypothetical protein DVJ77_20485 [Dyella tabacisoli]
MLAPAEKAHTASTQPGDNMKTSSACRLVAWFLTLAGAAPCMPAHAQSPACEREKLDALHAKRDLVDARSKGAELPDISRTYKAFNVCLKEHGLAEDPSFSVSNDSDDRALLMRYMGAMQQVIRTNWLHPDNIPASTCRVRVTQLPGGDVVSAVAESSCPYNAAGRRSVENAVLRAQPLPYKGFESVFRRTIVLTFDPRPWPSNE